MTAPSIDDQLRNLGAGIPVPELSTAAPNADISAPAPSTDDIAPEFGAPRKRRTRARKPTTPPPAVEQGPAPEVAPAALDPVAREQIAKAFGVGFRVVAAIVASKRGQHWQLAEPEEQMLGAVWTDALGPYLVTNAKYMPLAIATLATVGIIMPRMDADARLRSLPVPDRNPDVPQPAPTNAAAAPAHSD